MNTKKIIRSLSKVLAAGIIRSAAICLIAAACLHIHFVQAAGEPIYYSDIKNIIRIDCGRCHSGPVRNLMDFDNLKTYADSGMLKTMVNGPMRSFAGNDTQKILDWVNAGAPEKPGTTRVNFLQGTTPAANKSIRYEPTIKNIIKADCSRCHSGPFRNLSTYKNVKMYVDNGLLKTLVRLGGPMHRFAGPDSRLIVQWVNNGAVR